MARACDRCKYVRDGKPECLPIAYPQVCDSTDCCGGNARFCSFTIKNKSDLRKYRNSIVFCEEDNSSYWVDSQGVPVITYRMPIYEDNFNPADAKITGNTVYDFVNNKGYVFDPGGDYREFQLYEQEGDS